MRAGQNGQAGEPVRMAVRYAPCDLTTPIVSDKVKSLLGVAAGLRKVDDILDEALVAVVLQIRRVGASVR